MGLEGKIPQSFDCALLNGSVQALKLSSHEAYERFRTEKLLVRKARSLGYGTTIDGFTASTPNADVNKTMSSVHGHGKQTLY
jgi:hypothetical protein